VGAMAAANRLLAAGLLALSAGALYRTWYTVVLVARRGRKKKAGALGGGTHLPAMAMAAVGAAAVNSSNITKTEQDHSTVQECRRVMEKHVYILTWCGQAEHLYGTTLIFRTLRDGFPSFRVHIVDNASLPECRTAIRDGAKNCNAEFTQIEQTITHHEFVEKILNTQAKGSAIFVDPDICFWENVEDWEFGDIMAGRRIPKFACEYSGCITHPRLHTSFLWIPDVCALRDAIRTLRGHFFDFEPFRPIMFRLDNTWQRFDTGASLFSAFTDQMHCFTESELNSYDHLFCGTHIGSVAPSLQDKYTLLFERMHNEVQANHLALRGAWRIQEEYFNSRSVRDYKGPNIQLFQTDGQQVGHRRARVHSVCDSRSSEEGLSH